MNPLLKIKKFVAVPLIMMSLTCLSATTFAAGLEDNKAVDSAAHKDEQKKTIETQLQNGKSEDDLMLGATGKVNFKKAQLKYKDNAVALEYLDKIKDKLAELHDAKKNRLFRRSLVLMAKTTNFKFDPPALYKAITEYSEAAQDGLANAEEVAIQDANANPSSRDGDELIARALAKTDPKKADEYRQCKP